MSTIGERIKAERDRQGLSQTALARAVGMDRDKMNKIERGTRDVSGGEIDLFAAALGVRFEALLRDSVKVYYRGNRDKPGVPAAEAIFNRFIENFLDARALVWPLEH